MKWPRLRPSRLIPSQPFPRLMTRRSCLLPVCALSLLVTCPHPARAGDWVVTYQRDGLFQSQFLNVSGAGMGIPVATRIEDHLYEIAGPQFFSDGVATNASLGLHLGAGFHLMLHRNTANTGTNHFPDSRKSTVSGSAPGTAKADYTLQATLRWKRAQVRDAGSLDGPLHDDPTDNPPKYVWVVEEASIVAGGNPEFTFSHFHHPLGQEAVVPGGLPPDSPYRFYLHDRLLKAFRVKNGVAACPPRQLQLQIDLPAADADHLASPYSSNAQLFYSATPVTFATLARLKVDHDPANLSLDYASSADIAAGHIVNTQHLHEADVALQVLDRDEQSVGSVKMPYLPRMEVVNPQGVEQHISLLHSDAPKLDRTDGAGRIALAKLTARDLVTNPQTAITVKPKNATGSGADVGESWANVEWKMGENGQKPWETRFIVGDSGYKEWAWAELTTVADKPLVGHTLKFFVDYFSVQVTDPDTKETRTKVLVVGSPALNLYSDNLSYDVTYCATAEVLTQLVAPYFTPPAAQVSKAVVVGKDAQNKDVFKGVVKGQFTVKSSDSFAVNNFRLVLEDQNVYIK